MCRDLLAEVVADCEKLRNAYVNKVEVLTGFNRDLKEQVAELEEQASQTAWYNWLILGVGAGILAGIAVAK